MKNSRPFLVIAARRSHLARWQAQQVGAALLQAHPHLKIKYIYKSSLGDLDQDTPLNQMGQQGVFTADFRDDLMTGRCDLVVHSWKDLPTDLSSSLSSFASLADQKNKTEIIATLPRADERDVLLIRPEWRSSQRTILRILSSSPRRQYNLSSFLSQVLPMPQVHLEFLPVRGNILTRLQKMLKGEGDALVVAKAALDRLLTAQEEEFLPARNEVSTVMQTCDWMVLPLSHNPTAAAQGALAIEIASHRKDLQELCEKINDKNTFYLVEQERKILAQYGGGCQQKIGVTVLHREMGRVTFLRGETLQGEILNQQSLRSVDSKMFPLALSEDQIFPRDLGENRWFKRIPLPNLDLKNLNKARYLWVARQEGWPDGFQPAPGAIIWAAGVKTWSQLAKRGIWVHGCADGLGDQEEPRLEPFLGSHHSYKSVPWLYLTHDRSTGDRQRTIESTYRLEELPNLPDLRGRTHFFWMSGSSFLAAWKKDPLTLRNGCHACGPGHTRKVIHQILGAEPFVFLDFFHWRKTVTAKMNLKNELLEDGKKDCKK